MLYSLASPQALGPMNRFSLLLALAFTIVVVGCQSSSDPESSGASGSDIWLFELDGGDVELLERLTDREGYDNQPMFLDDGRLLFVSDRAGRANIHLYDIESDDISQLTFTDADKYSPTPIPGTGGREFSVVHTDSIAQQGLWRYSVDGSTEPGPIADVDWVAYYTWVGQDKVLFWRLTQPIPTVQLLDTITSSSQTIVEDSAFSFKQVPGEEASSYLARWADDHAEIWNYDWNTGVSTVMALVFEDGSDFTWTLDGRLLMMQGSELYSFKPDASDEWERVAKLRLKNGSRLVVSPNGRLLAVVGNH